jgi:ATP-dependent DNA helicase RecG
MKSKSEIKTILESLCADGYENEVVEFKEAKTKYAFDKIGEYFSSLCNEANLKGKDSAWLIFGVENKSKKIVGSQFRKDHAHLNDLKHQIADFTTGNITFVEIYEEKTSDGRVILFEIPAAPKGMPIAWRGHYYGRDGESSTSLNITEIERIRSQAKGEDWSAVIIKNSTLEDLSPEALKKAREFYKQKNSHLANEINDWDDITFLNKAKLSIKGKITRTAILLLGKSESEHFINPATAKISWILRDHNNIEKDYQHFTCPLLLNTEEVYKKIRNLKYRYITDGTLFPEEVDQYDPYIIREGLNNCIAHQDYSLSGKINLVEYEDGRLIFINSGKFIPLSVEEVVISDAPEPTYRNPFLVEAMINLKMIDAIGSGIKTMFNIQRQKFFPLPDYEFTNNKVKLIITGKVVDINYARKVASVPDLSLANIIALDKVSKSKPTNDDEIKSLKNKGLIEGRKPNFHISATVAKATGDKAKYIKLRGFDDGYYKDTILKYLEKYAGASKKDLDELIYDKLPEILDEKQKYNKIRNILYSMSKKDKSIKNTGSSRYPKWAKL